MDAAEPLSSARRRLVARLLDRSPELVGRWQAVVRERLDIREASAFPPEQRFARVPGLLDWVVGADPRVRDLPPVLAGALGHLVVLRRGEHRLLEELLIELRELQAVLLEAVREEAVTGGGAVEWCSPGDVLDVAGGIAGRMAVITTLVAGMYNEELEQERREERRKLDDFTRMVSHEMRTPIGAAFTAARMLQEIAHELPREERDRMLEIVGRGLARATRLLESVTSLALARRDDRDPERFKSLRRVVEDVITEVREKAEAAGVRLEVQGALPNAEVDGRRGELVLLNLISNAVKYADPEKEDRWVRIGVERDPEQYGWRIRVADNGVGIPPEERGKVFRRFYRAHSELAGGTGLGLVIVREAVEQLGGEISLESAPGKGSTFTFTLPDPELPDPVPDTAGGR